MVDRIMRIAEGLEGSPSAPVHHHLVPESYLRRWAEQKRIRVTDLRDESIYVTSPGAAAKERDFYKISSSAVPSLLYEVILGELEGTARQVIDDLLEADPAPWVQTQLGAQAWTDLSNFLAFQVTRGRAFREQMEVVNSETFKIRTAHVTDEASVRRELEPIYGRKMTQAEVSTDLAWVADVRAGRAVMRLHRNESVSAVGEYAVSIQKYIANRNWTVWRAPGTLMTSDEPVVTVGGPGHPRDQRAGFFDAGALVFPLSPDAALVMFDPFLPGTVARPGTLDRLETIRLNREIGAHATRLVFERPSQNWGSRLRLSHSEPTARFERCGRNADGSELYQIYKPTRWSSMSEMPPWPVSRWSP